MPLASIVQAAGIATLEPLLGTFRSAQAVIVLVAAFVPAVTYAAARNIGVTPRAALAGAAFAGIGGGAFAPAWVTLDSFAIASVVGTCFFMPSARAADGDVRAGALAGALVGLLFLARAEGSLFGVALLALAARPMSRRAGVAGAIVALAVGLGWLARGQLLGGSPDLLTRSALLFRYEDFFAITPTGSADLAALVTTRLGALWSDLIVALFGLFVLLAFPLFLGLRAGWRLPAVRAFAGLAILIYVAEGLIWPLHATRGSYFHSLAAFYPFAMAVVALGGETWLARRDVGARRLAVTGTLAAAMGLAVFGLATWDTAVNTPYRMRVAALDAIPPAPLFLAATSFAIAVSLPSGDPDTYWHLASAKWMIDHGQLLKMDVFSSTVTGEAYSVGEWLGQLVLYAAYLAGGWTGIALLRATLVAIGAFFLTRAALRVAPAPFAIAITAFALALSEITWTDRPQLFTFALFPMLFEVLIAARAGRTALLAAVPPLLLVWTNLHGGDALGLALVAIFAGDAIPTRPKPLPLAPASLLCLSATFIHPRPLCLC